MGKHSFSCIATDCGGSGCKALFADFDGERIVEREYASFSNRYLTIGQDVFMDADALFSDSQEAIGALAAKWGNAASLGFDTRGGAYFLLDAEGRLVRNPYHYAGPSLPGIVEELHSFLPKEEIYACTGSISSRGFCLPWLYADTKDPDGVLERADKLVMFSDYMTYLYSGHLLTEKTIASTSGFAAVDQKDWAWGLLKRIGVPERLFMPFTEPCIQAGKLLPGLQEKLGIRDAAVVTVAGHDSAVGVSSLPGFSERSLYIGLGTAANINFLSTSPYHSAKAFAAGLKTASFPGEDRYMIYCDTPAFLVYEHMKACFEKRGAVYPYAELSAMAAQEPQFRSIVDLATPSFALDGNDVLALMAQQLKERHMAVPENDAQWVRLFFNSLTAKVCQIMDFLKSGFGKSFDDIVIINGGSLHSALMQQIADASGLPVKAGIRYASLYGNVLNQLLAMGEVASPEEMRQVAAASLRFAEYEPRR